jgi:hypothetical protein
MLRRCKKLVTDIGRKAQPEEKLSEYVELLNKQYNYYAVVKMCMNYYTMKSMVEEEGTVDANSDVAKYFDIVTKLIEKYITGDEPVDNEALFGIGVVRENIEYKMHNLTAYTDGFEIYEYILNRVEARVNGTVEAVDIQSLADRMYAYVFQENDTVVINSKLKLLLEQLPVRMTKGKFYDVVTNTLTIYKGGDRASVDEFVDMLRTAVLIKKPKGFETEYPYLFSTYNRLVSTDYANIDSKTYEELLDMLNNGASIINGEASAYMLLQEIVNDVYTVLLTHTAGRAANHGEVGYGAALEILAESVKDVSIDEITEQLMPKFVLLEGVQEDVYETITVLESCLDDVKNEIEDLIEGLGLKEDIERLGKAEKLLSTSLFIPLDEDTDGDGSAEADNDYIMKLRNELETELKELFSKNSRQVNRSMMCKLISSMPVFMNTQQEIKDYFEYVLSNCNDDSELTACAKLVAEIIEE